MSLLQADRSILVNALLGALLPAAASALTLAAAARLWRDPAGLPARSWSLPLALGLAFAAGYAAISGWPPLPPELGITQWLFYVALFGGALGVYEAWRMGGARLTRALLSVAMPVALLDFAREHQWSGREAALWTGGLAVFLFLAWNALAAVEARARSGPLLLGWMAVEVLAAGAYQLSHSSLLAQLAGALAAGLLPCVLLGFWRPAAGAGPGIVAPFLLLHSGLVWAAHFASYLGSTGFVLLSLAPVAALAPLGPQRRGALSVALPSSFALAALIIEYRSASSAAY